MTTLLSQAYLKVFKPSNDEYSSNTGHALLFRIFFHLLSVNLEFNADVGFMQRECVPVSAMSSTVLNGKIVVRVDRSEVRNKLKADTNMKLNKPATTKKNLKVDLLVGGKFTALVRTNTDSNNIEGLSSFIALVLLNIQPTRTIKNVTQNVASQNCRVKTSKKKV